MLLEEDVQRIRKLGYSEDFFVTHSEGFKILANSSWGRCVFHDGKQCTIYKSRPKGCKLYPIIFDVESMSPVRDHDCPFKNEFKLTSKDRTNLVGVYHALTDERFREN